MARTWSGPAVRRIALAVEQEAMAFAATERCVQIARLGSEARTEGVPLILTEADGGKVRAGILVACEQGGAGFGRRTPKRDLPRRKRPSSFREVITMDAREPGATECAALDVLVPVGAPPGERARRMLVLAGRAGRGSPHPQHRPGRHGPQELAAAFDQAFFDYPGSLSERGLEASLLRLRRGRAQGPLPALRRARLGRGDE